VHPELLKRLVALACDQNLPVAMHLAESREELQLLRDGTGPFQQLLDGRSMWDPDAIPRNSRPLDYLRVLSEAPRALVIHGNYLDDEEIAFLAEYRDRLSVVYCPRTHTYFGHEPYPLEKMLGAGVRVVLGTDSRASNPDLSLLAEMRFVAKRFPSLAPAAILEMGTQASADALGFGNEVGSIGPGKFADLIALPCPTSDDPLEAILHGDAQPSHVFVRGRQVNIP
jgi:cytosine/adenosine deaminase-related metal-dependent hydrolase